ncbi:MAG: OmpA family protein [Deltaproteobacteria bacterium]|nr:MAG: OmpA family protein [Deltaproteobacteria bacterium]
MYRLHYKIKEKPFQISPDPRFLWLGEKHQEALAILRYGILNNQGFVLLTGDVGTGKTTLINALINDLKDDHIIATVSNPDLDKIDFFNLTAKSFNIQENFSSKSNFLLSLNKFLHKAYTESKKVLLLVDEAHKLPIELLEEIRLLSNIEKQETKLINIFFVGQNEFNTILMKEECRALRQRITITHHIEPLTKTETKQYVAHRLKVAGAKTEVFNKRAIRKVHAFSRGYPRLINIVCDQALLTGYARNLHSITPAVVKECAKELSLPGELRRRLQHQTESRKTKRAIPLGRKLVYVSAMFLLVFSGYSLYSTGYDEYYGKVKNYYGKLPQENVTAEQDNPSEVVTVDKPHPGMDSPPHVEKLPSEQISQQAREVESNAKESARNIAPENHGESTTPFDISNRPLIISFGYNSNEVPPEAYDPLDEIARFMLRNPGKKIVVRGYTDTLGYSKYNKKLSEFRANTVRGYLIAKGIRPDRIKALGMGEANPIVTNDTNNPRRENRRVELELVKETTEKKASLSSGFKG